MEIILSLIGVLSGSVLTFLGVRFTARQNAKAASAAAVVSSRQVDVDEWRSIVSALREEVSRLATRVEALETKRDTDRILIDTMKAEAEAHTVHYGALVRFTRTVMIWANSIIPDAEPPPVPAAFRSDLEGSNP